MTFISVGIMKTNETSEWAKYAFGGPPENVLGHVIIYKADGRIELVDIINDKYKKHILPCVIRRLSQHYQEKEYPDKTSYSA
jgi:hypothetical protein